MKARVTLAAIILPLLVGVLQPQAAEVETHQAYRVTSYNLGSLAGQEGNGSVRIPRTDNPLLISSSAADVLNSDHDRIVTGIEPLAQPTNMDGFAFAAEFDATESLSLYGAFGMARNLWTPDAKPFSNESSWEANLGIIYKLLGNFSYELHFGYMDTGDLFSDRSSYTNEDSIIMISNKLTLSF
ncbi:MAG: hypothetical protein ACWGOX_09110 [Desulforhopalus sp.]